MSTSKPIENHDLILTSMSEEDKQNDLFTKNFFIRLMTWLRPGVIAIIYDDDLEQMLAILDFASW